MGDRFRLEQVVTNMLANAIEHTEEDGVITIAVTIDEAWAVLRIADNGVGIDPADLEAIFALFYQGENDAHRKGGLGIGLR